MSDCFQRLEAQHYCQRHYAAFRKHGDPLIKAVSSARFNSARVTALWKTDEYRAKMAGRSVGERNPWFTGAKKVGCCQICGSSFSYYPSNGCTGRYCSRKCSYQSAERREKLRVANLGKQASEEAKANISRAHLGLQAGSKSGSWKGGISKQGQQLRSSMEYAAWRLHVFARDDYTCQLCDKRGGKLIADHYPYPFALFPDLRLELSNGRTLCQSCNHHVTYVTREWRHAALEGTSG